MLNAVVVSSKASNPKASLLKDYVVRQFNYSDNASNNLLIISFPQVFKSVISDKIILEEKDITIIADLGTRTAYVFFNRTLMYLATINSRFRTDMHRGSVLTYPECTKPYSIKPLEGLPCQI